LILPAAGGAPVLVVWDADSPLARETSIVEDVRTFRFGVDEPVSLLVGVARSVAPGLTRVAVDLSSRAIPLAFGRALAQELESRDLVDITRDLAQLRAVKTPAELALMRVAGSYGRQGLAAARRHTQPGMTQIRLAA